MGSEERSQVKSRQKVYFPTVLEITFVNKSNNLDYVNFPKNFPIVNLDFPNNPFNPDIDINFN